MYIILYVFKYIYIYISIYSLGMVDMSTSDGRFMFFLPWNGHVLVGTTDHKEKVHIYVCE
jgi:hypothetical protein